jgi:hypothetical protein
MFEQIKTKLDAAHRTIMPHSTIGFHPGALSSNVMFVHVLLGKGLDEMPNRIIQNDPLRVRFMITHTGDNVFEVEPTMSVGSLKPTEQYYAMSSEKIRTRKFTGDAAKVVATLTKYMTAVRDKVAQLDTEDKFLPGLSYKVSSKIVS